MSTVYLRWFWGLALLLAFLVSPPMSQAQCQLSASLMRVFAEETLTVSTTAIPLTAAVYNVPKGSQAQYAWVSVETNPIRYAFTRTPTSSIGALVVPPAGDTRSFSLCGLTAISQFRAIRTTADASITVHYYELRTSSRR